MSFKNIDARKNILGVLRELEIFLKLNPTTDSPS